MNGIVELETAEPECDSCDEIDRDKLAFLPIERSGLRPLCKPCFFEHVREGFFQVSVLGI